MATKSITLTKDNSSHQRYGNSDARHEGRGENTRLLMGRLRGDDDLRIRSFLSGNFSGFWDNVEEVEEAYIELTFADGGSLANGTTGRLSVKRITKDWSEHTNANFAAGGYVWPSIDHSLEQVTDAGDGTVDGNPISLNVIRILRQVAPKGVYFTGVGNGLAKTNYGFMVAGSPESSTSAAVQTYSSDDATAGNRPRLTIVYRPKNTTPVAGLIDPSGSTSLGFTINGTFQDDDDDDYLTSVQVQFRKASVDDWDTPLLTVAAAMRDTAGDWSIETFDRTKFRKATPYECRARVADRKGKYSAWTDPVNAFTITADSPTVTPTPIGSQPTLDGVLFNAPWTVDATTEIVAVYVQFGPVGFTTPTWQWSYPPTSDERLREEAEFSYGGPNLPAGNYEWRIKVEDALGGQSTWEVDDTLVLTIGVPDDEGDLSLTTGFATVMPNQRIVLYDMAPADRGPRNVVGILEDAANIGVSWYATAPGELYFTIPVTHPQVSVIEPMTTHYSFQQYRQGRWKEMAAGLIRDFDANGDDMVAYGLDYLGLLSRSIEAAKQSTKDAQRKIPTIVTGTDGSKYVQRTIKSIIVDQLKRARGQDPESPVKFIQTGRIDSFSTKVTIYASFAERLSFIRGLIDSHKGGQANGEERRSRLRVRFNPSADGGKGRYQFEALDAVGQDRDNVRLEYGGLIQGYRVIALDEFATMVYGIGKVPNHTLPYFSKVNAPGISQADWGALGMANYWNDIVDEQDLRRRARNMATRMSRIGKRIALGIRVAGILPFDGYDLLDSFPIVIEDGVVSTSQYGSGYWTLWGMEYRVYPDEHDEMTFILRPKGDGDAIDSDLIPSQPIHYASDWVWGSGPP